MSDKKAKTWLNDCGGRGRRCCAHGRLRNLSCLRARDKMHKGIAKRALLVVRLLFARHPFTNACRSKETEKQQFSIICTAHSLSLALPTLCS